MAVEDHGGPGPDGAADPPRAHPRDAQLALLSSDSALAAFADPFPIALGKEGRESIVRETARSPAQATRLELSALGGTLSATGRWDNFAWEHDAVLGRDMRVRTVAPGVLYPLGHRAQYEEFTERVFDPGAGDAAVLRSTFVLTVTEPVRRPPADGPDSRAFPFGEVEITRTSYADLNRAAWQSHPFPGATPATYFSPATPDGRPLAFPIRCATPDGPVAFDVPLIFVKDLSPNFASLTDPGLAQRLADVYAQVVVPLPGSPIDLARSQSSTLDLVRAAGRTADVHEVHSITIEGNRLANGYRPKLGALEVALPALRSLIGDDAPRTVRFAEGFLRDGDGADVLLELAGGPPIDINFAKRADRSGGLVAPHFSANAISRTLGPIDLRASPNPVTGLINPGSLFPADATILGFPLRDLVTQLRVPPEITSLLQPGGPPEVRMLWVGVKLKSFGPFQATAQSTLDVTVTSSATGASSTATVRNFALLLPSTAHPLLRLHFGSVTFEQLSGQLPKLKFTGVDAKFLGELQLLEELQDAVDLAGADPYLDVTPTDIKARYSLPLPPVSAGAFVMRCIVLSAGITVPFDGRPVTVSLGFASRENPFVLTVMMFGGGGYVEILIDNTGLRRLEAALEFGAFVAVDFVVASAEVHALGGIRFTLENNGSVSLTGYLRIGGCVDILGLLSVSVELNIALAYQSTTKALVGRATLVVEIDLTLWSTSVELDSGEWVLAGGSDRPVAFIMGADDGLSRWQDYRAAFVQEPRALSA